MSEGQLVNGAYEEELYGQRRPNGLGPPGPLNGHHRRASQVSLASDFCKDRVHTAIFQSSVMAS